MAIFRFSALSLVIFCHLISQISLSDAQSCASQRFSNRKLYDHCNDLPQLSSYLHWTFDPSKSSLSIAFVAPPAASGGWISWAINPTGGGMLGAQSLIAFRQPNGAMAVKTYNVTSYASISESKVWFQVKEASAESSEGLMRIFATLALPEIGKTTVNQVWQVGASVIQGVPAKHGFQPANLNSKGTLDFMSGQSNVAAEDSRTKKKNIHGILNAVSWGFLFPMGVVLARYLRVFESADPAWFYLHVLCQCSAYVIGVAGWATGLKLGSESKSVTYSVHRNIGIVLFSLATVQIFALFLRPKKDHKYRLYWNIYHHGVGYSIVILSIINVFKGLDILTPAKNWKLAYIAVIVALAAIALLLEVITWALVLRRKSKPYNNELNGQ